MMVIWIEWRYAVVMAAGLYAVFTNNIRARYTVTDFFLFSQPFSQVFGFRVY